MTENIRKQLGEKARELRKSAKMTQQEVADKLGVRQTDVSAFESKGDVIGSVERINALFNLFDCELTISEKKTPLTWQMRCERMRKNGSGKTQRNTYNRQQPDKKTVWY